MAVDQSRITNETLSLPSTTVNRISCINIKSRQGIPEGLADLYSRMKYGDPSAVAGISVSVVNIILQNEEFQRWVGNGEKIRIISPAYGEVPTSAVPIAESVLTAIQNLFPQSDIGTFRLLRQGGFALSTYGEKNQEERKQIMAERRVMIMPGQEDEASDARVICFDDANITGTHADRVTEILTQAGTAEILHATYLEVDSELARNSAQIEEYLNRASVNDLFDMLKFYSPDRPFLLNSRNLKLILGSYADDPVVQAEALNRFFGSLDTDTLHTIYMMATSADNYFRLSEYRGGFQALEQQLVDRNTLEVNEHNARRRRSVISNLTVNENSVFVDMETGEDMTQYAEMYSLAKHGSMRDIKAFAQLITDKVIADLEQPDSLFRQTMDRVLQNDEHVVLMVPGSGNVESASNIMFDIAIQNINIYLARKGYKPIIVKKLSRLASAKSNYAELPKAERAKLGAVYDHHLPDQTFYSAGVHVIFGDDVLITGSTESGVSDSATDNKARSIQSMYALAIDPKVALAEPQIEHRLNTAKVKGVLDQTALNIFQQPDFVPIQRSLRMVLNVKNIGDLPDFLQHIPVHNVVKIYRYAMSGDYIRDDRYSGSLQLVENHLMRIGAIDGNGQIISKLEV